MTREGELHRPPKMPDYSSTVDEVRRGFDHIACRDGKEGKTCALRPPSERGELPESRSWQRLDIHDSQLTE